MVRRGENLLAPFFLLRLLREGSRHLREGARAPRQEQAPRRVGAREDIRQFRPRLRDARAATEPLYIEWVALRPPARDDILVPWPPSLIQRGPAYEPVCADNAPIPSEPAACGIPPPGGRTEAPECEVRYTSPQG